MHVWVDNDVVMELDILPILSGNNLTRIEARIENYLNNK
jgi:hypothetical protein